LSDSSLVGTGGCQFTREEPRPSLVELRPKVGDGGILRWRIMAAVEAAKHLEKE
jgi:hypothetical protein